MAQAVGPDKVGLRISPGSAVNDIAESDTHLLYPALLRDIAPTAIAYLHVCELGDRDLSRRLRGQWPGTMILNPHVGAFVGVSMNSVRQIVAETDGQSARAALDEGVADIISFGRQFISNPDLPRRLRLGSPLAPSDQASFYGGDQRGYTDYPALAG